VKIAWLVLGMLCCAMMVQAAERIGVASAPPIVWLNDTAEGTPEEMATEMDFTFTFRNDSGEPVSIVGAVPTCECTEASFDKDPVPPGGTGVITATFHFDHRTGLQEKGVMVFFDKFSAKEKALIFRAKLPDFYTAKPLYFSWTPNALMQLVLTFQDKAPVKITGLELDETFPATASVTPDADGKSWKLVITPKPDSPAVLEFDGHLLVATDARLPRLQEIPITIRNPLPSESGAPEM